MARGTNNRRWLNAADRLMLVGHEAMRANGHAGFQCQTHLWLAGRLDVSALTDAIGRLARRHPAMAARLGRGDRKDGPCWRWNDGETPCLTNHTLPSDDPTEVWAAAQALFESPLDLDRMAPVSFHVLSRPGDGDVLILRFSHVLMDGKSPEFLLAELNRELESVGSGCLPESPSFNGAASGGDDDVQGHLRRFRRFRRARAAIRVVRANIRWPVRPVLLTSRDDNGWQVAPYRLAARSLSRDATERLSRRVRRLCGFANLTPAVLASAFRTISRLSEGPQDGASVFQVDVPLNLRPPGRTTPVLSNFMSFVQLSALRRELADFDELTRVLNARMRDQIRREIDLGNVQMMSIMSRHTRFLRRHIEAKMRTEAFTLGFGFLGPVVEELNAFGGRRVEQVYTFNSAVSPPGITVQCNLFRGCLNLMLSYIGATVSDDTANRFLTGCIRDLSVDS